VEILCLCWFDGADSCCDGVSSAGAALSGDGSWSFFAFLWSFEDIRVENPSACCSDVVPSRLDGVPGAGATLCKILLNIFACRRNGNRIPIIFFNAAKDPPLVSGVTIGVNRGFGDSLDLDLLDQQIAPL